MRFSKLAASVAAVMFVAACGGGGDSTPQTPAQQPAAAPPPAAAGAPITGTTHVVGMVGDEKGTRFEPAAITIAAGDGIRFESISMPPHNVAFEPAKLSAEQKAAIAANMPDQELGELAGKLLNVGENYTLSFANVPPGAYDIICTPHLATGMRMVVTVK